MIIDRINKINHSVNTFVIDDRHTKNQVMKILKNYRNPLFIIK